MDVTLQRHCARYIYVIPDGLRELMSDISREVLRSQPDDTYTFIADYLDALLITRENARVSARFVQYLSEAAETIVELLNNTGMTREEANKSATIIQEAFKTWSDRKGILKEDEDLVIAKVIEEVGISDSHVQEAALVIQNAFRAFKMRQQRDAQLLSGIIDWRVAARSAIKLYRRTGVSPEEATRAANLIKAAYKGYYTRRAIRLLNEQQIPEEGEAESYLEGSSELSDLLTGERKSKGVRLDYSSIVPHVDFGGEELFSRDLASILEEEMAPPDHKDVMTRIFGEEFKSVTSDEEYIRQLLLDLIDSVVLVQDEVLPITLDRDSENGSFIITPGEESEMMAFKKASIMPDVSQDELENQRREAQLEMMQLKQASDEKRATIITRGKDAEESAPEATTAPEAETSSVPEAEAPIAAETEAPIAAETDAPIAAETEAPIAAEIEAPIAEETRASVAAEIEEPTGAEIEESIATEKEAPIAGEKEASIAKEIEAPIAAETKASIASEIKTPIAAETEAPIAAEIEASIAAEMKASIASEVKAPIAAEIEAPSASEVEAPAAPEVKDTGETEATSALEAEVTEMGQDAPLEALPEEAETVEVDADVPVEATEENT